MKFIAIGLLMVALVALLTFTGSGQDDENGRQGFVSFFAKGQQVKLKETAGRFEIITFDDDLGQLGHKITEVGPDFIVLEDITAITETRIPIYAIKSFVTINVSKKR